MLHRLTRPLEHILKTLLRIPAGVTASARRIVATAPYSLTIYRDLLAQAKMTPGLVILPFTGSDGAGVNDIRLFVRHDIDTAQCVRNMPLLLEIDADLNIPSAVYIRVDGRDYDPASCRSNVESLYKQGIEVGLHSACYVMDDSFDAFGKEVEMFASLFGFRARSFTMHGLGDFRFAQRQAFAERIVKRLPEFGMTMTDCNPSLREYAYVIEDCHRIEGPPLQRCIYDDFLTLPQSFLPGQNYLILTHPCYWR